MHEATGAYLKFRRRLMRTEFREEIEWARRIRPEDIDADAFALAAAEVVLVSGFRADVVNKLMPKVRRQLRRGQPVSDVFGHKSKTKAIEKIWRRRKALFGKYQQKKTEKEKLTFLETLPWIGPVTKFHLGRNLGMDVAKPDRHLVRIARKFGRTPRSLCRLVSEETGERVGVVDLVFWKAGAEGWM